MADFVVIFKANFAMNQSALHWSDQRFSNRGHHLHFQQQYTQMAKPLTSWLVSSFSQNNLCLVVSGCCLHVSVTKF